MLRNFLKEKVFKEYENFPDDLSDLFAKLNNATHNDESLLVNHLSIQPTRVKLDFFVAIHKMQNVFPGHTLANYRAAVDSMRINNWHARLNNSNLPQMVQDCINNAGGEGVVAIYRETNWDFVRCVRNLGAHLANNRNQITGIEADVFITHMFLNQLLHLQDCLHRSGVLDDFHL